MHTILLTVHMGSATALRGQRPQDVYSPKISKERKTERDKMTFTPKTEHKFKHAGLA